MKQENLLKRLENFILLAVIFLVPLAVLPLFSNPLVVPKMAILAFGVAAVLLIKAVRLFLTGKTELASTKFDLPVLVIAIAYLASAILATPNKMEAFFFPGTATLVLSATLIFFFVNQLTKRNRVFSALVLSAVATSVVALLAASGIFDTISQVPAIFKIKAFTTVDSPLSTAVFLLVTIPLGLKLAWEEKDTITKVFWTTGAAIILFGLLLSFFQLVPGKDTSPKLLDFGSSWAIAVDSLKDSPILGAGPGNYLTAFNRYRPLAFNRNELWAAKFTQGRNFYFTAISETGFLGAAGFVLLFINLYKVTKKRLTKLVDHLELASALLLVVLLAIFPGSIVLVTVLFILLALVAKPKENEFSLPKTKAPALIVSAPVIVGVLVFGFFATRTLAAESLYNKALVALSQNQGTQTYELLRQAINLSPRVDRYHASYAQVNMALAQSLSQKSDITEADRATISQLIQQAIREGKATATLNRFRADNWAVLAAIYRAIMPFAQGADNFALQTYQQAVALDPINPNLRINLGGVYFALARYDDAIKAFELSVLAKSDFANAHYNLAAAYREKGETQKAINELKIVLSLIDPASSDYQTAQTELEALEQKKVAPEAQVTTSPKGSILTPPRPAEEPVLTPPLELPENSQPPQE